jgi:hypothetical protein
MDTGWLPHHPDADAASSCGSASGASRLRRGIRLRLRRRRQEPARGGAGVRDDLALPLGMSFAAVLAQVRVLWRTRSAFPMSKTNKQKVLILAPAR